MKIQCSDTTYQLLRNKDFKLECRGSIPIKVRPPKPVGIAEDVKVYSISFWIIFLFKSIDVGGSLSNSPLKFL